MFSGSPVISGKGSSITWSESTLEIDAGDDEKQGIN